jgi:hypothetical protein
MRTCSYGIAIQGKVCRLRKLNLGRIKLMRPISPAFVASLSLMVFALIALHVDTASALKITTIKKVSRDSLQSTCSSAGGTFSTNSTGYYGCEKKNCDGKGGTCEVHCADSTKSCTGVTPLKQRPILATGIAGIQQLLTASSGKPPKSGTGAATSKGPLGGGLLDSGGQGMGASGPAATGAPRPAAPSAPSGPVLR